MEETLIFSTRSYHEDGSYPENLEIFVFGSNVEGRHGKGAAKAAVRHFGAIYGQGYGLMRNQSYAIPTKGYYLQVLPLSQIQQYVAAFCEFTFEHPHLRFFVTAVGCGEAGYQAKDIAPMFRNAINCNFPDTWKPYLE